MRTFNPIKDETEFKQTCKSNCENIIRVIEYVIDDLDSGWRNLSRRESDIRKHQLKFLEDLATQVQNAAAGSLKTNVRA